jgi:heptaprenyl diphosphate synthase
VRRPVGEVYLAVAYDVTVEYDELSETLVLPDLKAELAAVESIMLATLNEGCALLAVPAVRVTESGGKRLRAALVIATAAGAAGQVGQASRDSAVAVELVHHGSLVHDDLIDGALLRRGAATVNSLEGTERALLVGDYMLAKAGRVAASVSKEVAGVVAETIERLCTGQVIEMADVGDPNRTLEDALDSITGKTADLMEAACVIGGHCGGVTPEVLAGLRAYGHAFGLAFQLVDDVLDVVSTQDLLGKPVGADIRSGVYTVPIILARDRFVGDSIADALRAPMSDAAVASVLDIVRTSGAIEETVDMARAYAGEARDALQTVAEANPRLLGLSTLPEAYMRWALDTLVPHS